MAQHAGVVLIVREAGRPFPTMATIGGITVLVRDGVVVRALLG